jgi:hypothetical protein
LFSFWCTRSFRSAPNSSSFLEYHRASICYRTDSPVAFRKCQFTRMMFSSGGGEGVKWNLSDKSLVVKEPYCPYSHRCRSVSRNPSRRNTPAVKSIVLSYMNEILLASSQIIPL